MSISAVKKSPGRYQNLGRVLHISAARPVAAQASRMGLGAVASVDDPKERELVTINQAVDILEVDARNLSPEAYEEGRTLQAVWEISSGARMGSPGLEPSIGGDKVQARERAMIRRVTEAHQSAAIEAEVASVIGTAGVKFLRPLLLGEATFASIATDRLRPDGLAVLQGKAALGPSERDIAKVGYRFRDLLEELAAARRERNTARGASR